MSVLTLSGNKIDWTKPPKANTRVMWSSKDMYGRKVTGSLRTIAALDRLNTLSIKKFGKAIVVIQPPYNKGVKASAGTHDYDACLDVYIPGVDWTVQQTFFRTNGAGAYHRKPPKFGHHIHLFILPVQEGVDRADDWKVAGFTVGYFVDGGWSLYGKKKYGAQVEAYYAHRDALADNAKDSSWFPSNIKSTIFDLPAYIKDQAPAPKPPASAPPPPPGPTIKTTTVTVGHLNIPGPGVGIGPDLGNDANRIKQAVKLLGKKGKAVITFNELVPIQSKGVGSKFSLALAKEFGPTFTLIVPTLNYNENYHLYRNDQLTVVQQHADVVLTAPRGSGNKHLTPVTYRHYNGLEFVVGVVHLPPGGSAKNEADRQDMAEQARKVLASIAGTKPYILQGDINSANDLKGLVNAKMKRSRKYADKSDGVKATYTKYTSTTPSTNKAEEIDQTYFSAHWYVTAYTVARLLTALKKYVTPRPSDHDAIVSTARVNHY